MLINLKCFFGHTWQEESRRLLKYATDPDFDVRTRFLYVCQNCEKRKTFELDGNWIDYEK